MSIGISRRLCLLSLLIPAAAGVGARAADAPSPRLVVLDWGLTETLLALGAVPAGVAEIPGYDRIVATDPVPPGVADVGLRLAPNMELLQSLAPDAILINANQGDQMALLAKVGRVWPFSIYDETGTPYRNAVAVTRSLADRLGRPVQARALIETTQAAIEAGRTAILRYDGRPLYLFSFLDARHIALYDRSSLANDVLAGLGARNAWSGRAGGWGVLRASLESLAGVPEARLVCFGPIPEDARRVIETSMLWRNLPAIRAGRVRFLPPVWNYGALPTAARMAGLLSRALAAPDA